MDPLAESFNSWTPYHYVHGNPINLIDPTGMSASSPIFDENGTLMGTDDQGWEGEAIVMNQEDFTQGMSHESALEVGTELGSYTEGIRISGEDWATVENNGGNSMTPSVINDSNFTISYKPETTQNGQQNNGAYDLGPQSDLYVPVDGVAAPHVREGEVFKSVTGVQVTVSNNDVTTNTNGTLQSVGQSLKGGWKGESWNNQLNSTTTAPTTSQGCCGSGGYRNKWSDTSWNALFKKSQ